MVSLLLIKDYCLNKRRIVAGIYVLSNSWQQIRTVVEIVIRYNKVLHNMEIVTNDGPTHTRRTQTTESLQS